MLIRAMLGAMLVLTGMGLAQSAWMVLLFRLLQGLLTGTVTSSSALVASGTPDKHLSYALGFVSSSTFIGFSLGPAVGGLIAEHFGYRISFFVGTGIVFIGLILVLLFIEEPTPLMAGSHSLKEKTERTDSAQVPGIFSVFTILLFILFFFIRISRVMPTPFLPLFIQEMRGTIEGSARISGLLSGGIALAAAVSGLTLARLGDRMDRLKLLSILVGLGAVCSAFIPLIGGFTTIIISMLITYLFIGGVEPLLMSLTSEQVSSEKRGALFGVQTAVGSAAWFFSPLIASRASIRWSIDAVFICFTIMLILTWILSLFVRRRLKVIQ